MLNFNELISFIILWSKCITASTMLKLFNSKSNLTFQVSCLPLTALAVSILSCGGILGSRSLRRDCTKYVISLPAIGMCLMQLPIT